MSVENRVASTILEEPREIELVGTKFKVPPITFGTMIMFSSVVSEIGMSHYDLGENDENLWKAAIKEAKQGEVIADAIAVLIFGAKRIKAEKWWYRFVPRKMTRSKLRKKIIAECDVSEALSVLLELISEMHLGDFFALTTSLAEINLLKPKKEVVKTEATAYGQTL